MASIELERGLAVLLAHGLAQDLAEKAGIVEKQLVLVGLDGENRRGSGALCGHDRLLGNPGCVV